LSRGTPIDIDELAADTGISRRRILHETGHLDPTYEQLVALAAGLGIQPSAPVTLAE
jgi:hypothetical protein